MTITIVCLVIVIGGAFAWHLVVKGILGHIFAHTPIAIAYISTEPAKTENIQTELSAVGSLSAVHKVNVTAEVPGKVSQIYFKSGQNVTAGQLLVQLDDSSDRQDLANYSAQYNNAAQHYHRLRQASVAEGISKDALDAAKAQVEQAQAMVGKVNVTISQKAIKAPFAGKIGLRQVNIGQYLSPGASIGTLVAWDPLTVQFALPEQEMSGVHPGQKVLVQVDSYSNKSFEGLVSAIDSSVNQATRMVEVQATVPNKKRLLYPGSYATVEVLMPKQNNVTTVPDTAIVPSLYGDVVYVLKPGGIDKKDKQPYQIAVQEFVKIGSSRGGRTIIKSGLKAGDNVVVAGQLKLQNNSRVRVNNSVKLK